VHLALSTAHLVEALLLPLLAIWAGCGLTLLISLQFPRLTQMQLGIGVNLAGGNIGSTLAALPALAMFLAMVIDGPGAVGSASFFAAAAGIAALTGIVSVIAVARRFRPDAVLES
jgi:hypothetical protein